MRTLYFITILTTAFSLSAQTQNKNVFYVGHSICGTTMPNMVDDIAIDAGHSHTFDHQLIWGACLSKNWDKHDSAGVVGSDSWVELGTGNYDVVTLIEQIPLTEVINSNQWGCNYRTDSVGGLFYDLAISNNPNTKVYMVEVWNEFDRMSPTAYTDWKQLNDSQLPLYEEIVDTINAQHNGDMCIVPVRLALQNLTDSVELGVVPGLTSWIELFDTTDIPAYTVHLSEAGNYFSALVYYATIYGENPVGLTNITKDENGFNYPNPPSLQTALKMQEIVWETISTYSYSCVNTATFINEAKSLSNDITIFPNPVKGKLTILNNKSNDLHIQKIELLDYYGKNCKVFETNTNTIDLEDLNSGVYFVKIIANQGVLVKKIIVN